ncbi:MAG: hypothetical protein AAF206_29400 [Bacteroidota bacterium]
MMHNPYFQLQSARLRFRKLTEADIPLWRPFFDLNPNLPYLGLDLSQSKDQLADNWIRLQFGRYTAFGLWHRLPGTMLNYPLAL